MDKTCAISSDAAGALIIFAIFGIMIALFAIAIFEPSKEVCTQSNMIVIHDDIVTEGSFFLGSGSIDGEAKYFFYEQKEDGSNVLTSIDTYSDYYDEDYKPKVFQEDRTDGVVLRCKRNGLWFGDDKGHTRYEFHIPKGSIVTGYRLDAQ